MPNVGYYTDPARKLFLQKLNFSGGINNSTSDDLLPEKDEKNLINFDLSYTGALSKRAGFLKHTNLHKLPKLNEISDFSQYPTLELEESRKALKECEKIQGVFQYTEPKDNKEYLILLYCNQVYYKLSLGSDVKGTLEDYETWKPISMQKYDEANSNYIPYLSGTYFEFVKFKETEEQESVDVEVPIFSKVYDENGARKTIVGREAWLKFLQEDLAKVYKVDGVAYGGVFYLATGYKLMVIQKEESNLTAKQIKPVIPTTPEYNTIGGNLLSDDPSNAIKSSTGVALQVSGMLIQSTYNGKPLRSGLVNNPVTIEAITIRPEESMEVYFRFRKQKASQTEWENKNDTQEGWELTTLNGQNLEWIVNLNEATNYNFSVEVTPKSNIKTEDWTVINASLVESYVYTNYEVKEVPNFIVDGEFSLHTCRRLLTYYDQLIAYCDTYDGNVIYISDYRRFDYFPADYNTIIDTATKDVITSINYYQNVLIILTENNIFMLKGQNPYNFSLLNINRTIGCKYGWTAKVVENYLYFMSIEGLFRLKSIYNTEDRLNVEQVDMKINSLYNKDADNYIAITFKGNYYLVECSTYSYDSKYERVSNLGKIFILDTYIDGWTSYEGYYLNFDNILVLRNQIIATDRNTNSFLVYPELELNGEIIKKYIDGATYELSEDKQSIVQTDSGVNYRTLLEECENTFGKPYHTKKIKEFMVKVLDSKQGPTKLRVTALVDGNPVINPEKYLVSVDEQTGEVSYEIVLEDNIIVPSISTLGEAMVLGETLLSDYQISLHRIKFSGKGKAIKYIVEQVDDKFFGLLGFASVYKEKKPSVKRL